MHIYTNSPEALPHPHVRRVEVLYARHFFARDEAGKFIDDRVDLPTIDATAATLETDDPTPIMVDIESPASDLENNRAAALEQLAVLLSRFRSHLPRRKFGLYALLPERNYWAPVHHWKHQATLDPGTIALHASRLAEWKRRNTANAETLVGYVDFLVPSIYSFYADHTNRNGTPWWPYADANISEAVRIANGRPVLPILMPVLHTMEKFEAPTWEGIVGMLAARDDIAGVILFHSAKHYFPHDGWERPLLAQAT